MSKTVALTVLSRELTALTGQPAPSYRCLWEKVVNGEIRAVQKKSRWVVDPIEAAQDLGLTIKTFPKHAA